MIQHLARVSRILSKPFGNGLLVGLGGNGRKSIAKLASYINSCNTFEIALHKNYGTLEWADDLRNLYKTLGIDNKKTVFQFADKDIKEESFIEDINNILNVGELTSLFTPEDEEEINYEIEKQMKKIRGVKLTPYEIFMRRCKRNLHLLLIMSPDGNKLQNYFRKYPSLVNCTTIDWFLNWPNEALLAVANHFLLKQHSLIHEATTTITADEDIKKNKSAERTEERKRKKGLEPIAENEEREDLSNNDPAGSAAKVKGESESPAKKDGQVRADSKDYGNPEAFVPADTESTE